MVKKKIVKKEVKKVEEKKSFWGKLKYWQKGSIFGLLFSILFTLYMYVFHGAYVTSDISFSWFDFFHFIPLMLYAIIFNSTSDVLSVVSFLFVAIWYTLLGFLLGLIYHYLKKKNTKYSIFLFILVFFIFLIAIFIINYVAIGLLMSGAA